MEKVTINVGKTPGGYCASIDILPGWIMGICGRSHPKKEQVTKIINGFHNLGKELISVSV